MQWENAIERRDSHVNWTERLFENAVQIERGRGLTSESDVEEDDGIRRRGGHSGMRSAATESERRRFWSECLSSVWLYLDTKPGHGGQG